MLKKWVILDFYSDTSATCQRGIKHNIQTSELYKRMCSQTNININLSGKHSGLFNSYSSHSHILHLGEMQMTAAFLSSSSTEENIHIDGGTRLLVHRNCVSKWMWPWRPEIDGCNHVAFTLRILCIKTPILHSNIWHLIHIIRLGNNLKNGFSALTNRWQRFNSLAARQVGVIHLERNLEPSGFQVWRFGNQI